MTRRAGGAVVAMLALACLLAAPAAGAQEDGEDEPTEVVFGTLIDKKGTQEPGDDEPVEGAVITISQDGEEIGSGESDENGQFEIPLPGPGNYTAVLDLDTLPEGVGLAEGSEELAFEVRPGSRRTLIFSLGARTRDVQSTFDQALQLAFSGARFGLIIGICAIGLSLIYGTTGLTNFMHAELVTFGGIVAYFANTTFGLHIAPAAVVAMLVTGIAGGLLGRGLWQPLRHHGVSLLAMMVVSIGLSLFLRNVFQLWFGESPRPYREYAVQRGWNVGPIIIAPKDIWAIAIALGAMVLVGLLLQRSRVGKAIRAVADNPDLAASSGIDVDRVIVYVWAGGAALAALGGTLFALNERIGYNSGFNLLLLMFAGITLGGLGTAYGALVGSFVVGMFVNVSTLWVPAEMKNVGALLVLILVLLVRPQGILGHPERVG